LFFKVLYHQIFISYTHHRSNFINTLNIGDEDRIYQLVPLKVMNESCLHMFFKISAFNFAHIYLLVLLHYIKCLENVQKHAQLFLYIY